MHLHTDASEMHRALVGVGVPETLNSKTGVVCHRKQNITMQQAKARDSNSVLYYSHREFSKNAHSSAPTPRNSDPGHIQNCKRPPGSSNMPYPYFLVSCTYSICNSSHAPKTFQILRQSKNDSPFLTSRFKVDICQRTSLQLDLQFTVYILF